MDVHTTDRGRPIRRAGNLVALDRRDSRTVDALNEQTGANHHPVRSLARSTSISINSVCHQHGVSDASGRINGILDIRRGSDQIVRVRRDRIGAVDVNESRRGRRINGRDAIAIATKCPRNLIGTNEFSAFGFLKASGKRPDYSNFFLSRRATEEISQRRFATTEYGFFR